MIVGMFYILADITSDDSLYVLHTGRYNILDDSWYVLHTGRYNILDSWYVLHTGRYNIR